MVTLKTLPFNVLSSIVLFSMTNGKKIKVEKNYFRVGRCKTIPWGIGMLIGGGLAIASSFKASGLIPWIENNLHLGGISFL